ncbi:hypothetical protein PG994_008849 [Apiospora phragmitis]|uniref:Uncharacterized protein n=1 Tax=Apiospora phragmitis TaxID=2905665 RepID=A0ABR1UJZ5_9PEZI
MSLSPEIFSTTASCFATSARVKLVDQPLRRAQRQENGVHLQGPQAVVVALVKQQGPELDEQEEEGAQRALVGLRLGEHALQLGQEVVQQRGQPQDRAEEEEGGGRVALARLVGAEEGAQGEPEPQDGFDGPFGDEGSGRRRVAAGAGAGPPAALAGGGGGWAAVGVSCWRREKLADACQHSVLLREHLCVDVRKGLHVRGRG